MTHDEIEKLPALDRAMALKAEKRGLSVTYDGRVWHVRGIGVDVSVTALRFLSAENLKPPAPRMTWFW